MPEKGRISVRQFTVLVFLITVGDSILVLPSIPALEAKQDAWISGLLGLIIGLSIIHLFCFVGKLYPRLTLVEYNREILGKWLGTAVSLTFLAYAIISVAAHVREIGSFMTTHIMVETPLMAIHILLLSIIIMGARLGIETIARSGEIFFPWFVMLFILLVVALSPEIQMEKLLPVLEGGVKPVLRGSITTTAFPFMEVVVFLMIFPFVNQPEKIRKSFVTGGLLGGTVILAIVTLCILVLGADLTSRHIYPGYILARKINIGDFFERVEIIMGVMWVMTTYFKITFYYYVFSLGLAQVLKLKDYRMLPLAMSFIVLVLALAVAPSSTYFHMAIAKYWPLLDATCSVFLPLLLLGVYAFRNRIGKKS